MWLQADVRCAIPTFVVNGYSLPRTQRTTRTHTCTSSQLIGLRALWQARPYCHLHSNIYLVYSPATTGGWGWAYGYCFHWRGDFKGVYSSSSLLWQGGSADVIELYSLCRTSWERLSSESRVYLSGVEVLLIMCYRLLTPMFNDSHPCVRYRACQSV